MTIGGYIRIIDKFNTEKLKEDVNNKHLNICVYIIRNPNNTNTIQHLFTIVNKNGRCNNFRLYSKQSKEAKI